MIHDGPSLADPIIVWLSGNEIPQPVTTSTENVTISFQTDSFNNGAGFQISYYSQGKS